VQPPKAWVQPLTVWAAAASGFGAGGGGFELVGLPDSMLQPAWAPGPRLRSRAQRLRRGRQRCSLYLCPASASVAPTGSVAAGVTGFGAGGSGFGQQLPLRCRRQRFWRRRYRLGRRLSGLGARANGLEADATGVSPVVPGDSVVEGVGCVPSRASSGAFGPRFWSSSLIRSGSFPGYAARPSGQIVSARDVVAQDSAPPVSAIGATIRPVPRDSSRDGQDADNRWPRRTCSSPTCWHQAGDCSLIGIGRDEASLLEVVGRLFLEPARLRNRGAVENRVRAIEEVTDPSSTRLEHDHAQLRKPIEHAQTGKMSRRRAARHAPQINRNTRRPIRNGRSDGIRRMPEVQMSGESRAATLHSCATAKDAIVCGVAMGPARNGEWRDERAAASVLHRRVRARLRHRQDRPVTDGAASAPAARLNRAEIRDRIDYRRGRRLPRFPRPCFGFPHSPSVDRERLPMPSDRGAAAAPHIIVPKAAP